MVKTEERSAKGGPLVNFTDKNILSFLVTLWEKVGKVGILLFLLMKIRMHK